MAKAFNPEVDRAKATGQIPIGETPAADSPKYDKDLKPSRPAIKDSDEALDLAKAFVAANQDRVKRDAFFLSKLDNDPPYDNAKLRNSGSAWQSNVSSGFLSTIVNRVLPSFARAVNATKYLTTISVKDNAKSIQLQELVTKTIRSWEGWNDLMSDVIYENTSLGRAALSFGDQYNWKPKFYSTSNALLPEGCSQNVAEIPIVVLLDDWLLHEFIDKIKDRETSEGAGWDIDNCVKALNSASPAKRNQDIERDYQDWITQGAYARTYGHSDQTKPKTVQTFTILAQEPDEEGKVSEIMITREGGLQLYESKGKYNNMTEAFSLFTYTRGNGTAHGSKGLCRLLINLHQVYDRNFNKILDDTYLAGCRILEMPEGKRINAAIKVQQPFIITPPGVQTQPSNISINVDAFYAIVRQLQGLAEQTAGSYIPNELAPSGATDKTATEAQIDAAQQAEVKEGILGRFLYQFQKLITTMTKRLLDKGTYDEVAKKLQKQIIEEVGITREELDEALEAISLDNVVDYSSTVRNAKILRFIGQVGMDNPAYNASRLSELLAETIVDSDFADDVVIPKPDPSADLASINKQQIENGILLGGKVTEIIPDPLDNDLVHLTVMMAELEKIATGQQLPTPDSIAALNSLGGHMAAHIEQAANKGVKPKELKPFEKALEAVGKQLELYAKQLAQIGQAAVAGLSQQQPGQVAQLPAGGGSIPVPPSIGATPTGEVGGMAGSPVPNMVPFPA